MAQQKAVTGKPRTVRLPLMGAYSNRGDSGNKDQRFLNIFPETRKVEQLENTKIFLNKRPGVSLHHTFPAGEGRNSIYWHGKFYAAITNKVYALDGVIQTEILTLTNSTGYCGMIAANSSVLGDYLFICDGTSGWVIKTDGTVLTVSNTAVGSITLTNAGMGYHAAPTVTFSSGAATATATVVGGVVTSITLNTGGSGYVSEPTITIAAPVLTFNPSTAVSIANDTITVTGHLYATGNSVTYSMGGGSVIGGLTNNTVYYIIVVDANTIKLATSASNATAGTSIDLSSVGTGTTHTLTGTTTATATCLLNEFPTPHVPVPTFIDGYIALARANSVDVYTCDLDDPVKWSAESFLSAEMFPDSVVSLARQNNQVVVFGTTSIEFFYDAANASGSPLARNDSTTIQMGTCAPYAIYQNEQYCAYISQSDSGGRAVWFIEGFQPRKVSDEYIERILDAETNIGAARAYGLRTKGHLFYLIHLPTLQRTLLYDKDEKLWHEWSSNVDGEHEDFQYISTADNSTGAIRLLHNSTGALVKLDPNVYTDNGTPILVELTTNKYDMDMYARKVMHSATIVGDRYETSNPITLEWTDDDYQTWSNEKTIDLSDSYPIFQRLGTYRRRAFRLKHSEDKPLRLESLECTYSEGTY